jgi:hypothetical protein
VTIGSGSLAWPILWILGYCCLATFFLNLQRETIVTFVSRVICRALSERRNFVSIWSISSTPRTHESGTTLRQFCTASMVISLNEYYNTAASWICTLARTAYAPYWNCCFWIMYKVGPFDPWQVVNEAERHNGIGELLETQEMRWAKQWQQKYGTSHVCIAIQSTWTASYRFAAHCR